MNLNFNEICRLCLRFCKEYIDLSQTNAFNTSSSELMEKIKFCYFIEIDLSDGLPTKICYECIQVVTFFHVAKKNILMSEELLRNVLNVRKKLQDKTVINREESVSKIKISLMISSNINDINQVRQKNRENSSLFLHNTLNDLDQNVTKLEVELNCDKQAVDNSEKNSTPTDIEKSNSVTASDDIVLINLENDFRLQNKEKQASQQVNSQERDIGLLLNDPNNELVLSLKFKDLKKLKNHCRRNSEMAKD